MAYLQTSEFANDETGRRASEILQSFNVRHIEQLFALAVSPRGRVALQTLMSQHQIDYNEVHERMKMVSHRLETPRLGALFASSQTVAPSMRLPIHPFGLGMREDFSANGFSLPLHRPHNSVNETAPQVDVEKLPSKCCIFEDGKFDVPKDQGVRGTCVAFAVNSMLKAFIVLHHPSFRRSTDFSEQYLYFRAKREDTMPNQEGTSLRAAMVALTEHGVCADSFLQYRNVIDWPQASLFEEPRAKLNHIAAMALKTRVKSYRELRDVNLVLTIKDYICKGNPVCVGVLCFQEAWFNDHAFYKGDIENPLLGVSDGGVETLLDQPEGAHAICIVGYCDDDPSKPGRPGGGYFIFKNSWGVNWAHNSDYYYGYGQLTYDYVTRYCTEAVVLTEILLDNTVVKNAGHGERKSDRS